MGEHLVIERYRWFDREVRASRLPNASTLAEKFEICRKTARRDIRRMRYRYGAPLIYDESRRGYVYSDETYALSNHWLTQEEMLALLLAKKLLSQATGGFVSKAMEKLWNDSLNFNEKPTSAKAEDSFSAAWPAFIPAPAGIFRTTADCALNRKVLKIIYAAPKAPKPTQREIEPHHLQYYSGDWMLTAFCRSKNQWRKFHLGRVQQAEALDESFEQRPRQQWRPQPDGAFGIFQGSKQVEVTLRFNPSRAPWIKGQIWHENQKVEEQPDGAVELIFPVADFREIKLKILQFGSEVEVLAPQELRQEIIDEIPRMAKLYGAALEPAT